MSAATDTRSSTPDDDGAAPTSSAADSSGDAKSESAGTEKPVSQEKDSAGRGRGTVTLSVRTLLIGLGAAAVVIAGAVLIWLVVDKAGQIDDLNSAAKDKAHAEQVALDYATGAANMSYEDTQGWLTRLTDNTTPELSAKLRNAASQMEQLLRPMQWSSTSTPITAKVESVDGNVYQVDAFVQIVTKNVQTSASGIDTTATYKLTIDKDQGWKITAITSNGTNFDADGASPEGNNTEGNNAGGSGAGAAGDQKQQASKQSTPAGQNAGGQNAGN